MQDWMNMKTGPFTLDGQGVALRFNVPWLFAREDFQAWLNSPGTRCMTWHTKGHVPNEYSDVVVLIDPELEGEGSDDDMPGWSELIAAVRNEQGRGSGEALTVRLTNLQE